MTSESERLCSAFLVPSLGSSVVGIDDVGPPWSGGRDLGSGDEDGCLFIVAIFCGPGDCTRTMGLGVVDGSMSGFSLSGEAWVTTRADIAAMVKVVRPMLEGGQWNQVTEVDKRVHQVRKETIRWIGLYLQE